MLGVIHAFRQANGFYTDEYRRYAKACRAEVVLRRRACTDPALVRGRNGRLSHFGKRDLEALLEALRRGGDDPCREEDAGRSEQPVDCPEASTEQKGADSQAPDTAPAVEAAESGAPADECYFRPSADLLLFVLFQAEKAYALALSVRSFIATDSEKLRSLPFGKLSRGMIRHFRRAAERARMAEELYSAIPEAVRRPEDWGALRSLYSPASVAETVDGLRLYRNCVTASLSQQEDDYVETLRALQTAGLLTLRLARSSPDPSARDEKGVRSLEILLGLAEAGDSLSLGPDGEPVDPATGVPALDAFLHLFSKPLENSRSTVLAFMGPSQANRRALDKDLGERSSAELRACEEAAQAILGLVQKADSQGAVGSGAVFSYRPVLGQALTAVLLPEGGVRRALSRSLCPEALSAIRGDVREAFTAISSVYGEIEQEIASRPPKDWSAGLQEFLGFKPMGRRFAAIPAGARELATQYRTMSAYVDRLSNIAHVFSDFSERPAPRELARLRELSARLSSDVQVARRLYALSLTRHYALHIVNPGAFAVAGTPLQSRPEEVLCAVIERLAPLVLSKPPASFTPKSLAALLNSEAARDEILGRAGGDLEAPAALFISLCRLMYCAIASRQAASLAAASVSAQYYSRERGVVAVEYPGLESRDGADGPGLEGAGGPLGASAAAADFSPASGLQGRLQAAGAAFSAAEALTSAFSSLLRGSGVALDERTVSALLGVDPASFGAETFSLQRVRTTVVALERVGEALYDFSTVAAKSLYAPEEDAAPPPCMPAFSPRLALGDAVPELLGWEYVFDVEDTPVVVEEVAKEAAQESRDGGSAVEVDVAAERAPAGSPIDEDLPRKSQQGAPGAVDDVAGSTRAAATATAAAPASPDAQPRKQGIVSKLTSFFGIGSKEPPAEPAKPEKSEKHESAADVASPKQKRLFGLF